MKKMLDITIIGLTISLMMILASPASAIAETSQDSIASLCPVTFADGLVKEKIQKLTGSANEAITCHGTTESSLGNVYDISTKDGRFLVNVKTGEVESAVIRNVVWVRSLDPKDLIRMRQMANDFVKKNYLNFTTKNMVLAESRVIDHGDAGKEYLFVWNEMVGDVYTPAAVMISILPDWNSSITFAGIDRPLVVDTVPKISRDEAQNNALRAFDMGAGAITQSKLAVIPLADSQKLVWIIDTVELDKENFSHGGRVIVDAVSGTVISTNPLQ